MPCLPQAPSGQPSQPLPSEGVGHSSSGQGLCSLGERVLGSWGARLREDKLLAVGVGDRIQLVMGQGQDSVSNPEL